MTKPNHRIAILGATSHIAKGLIVGLAAAGHRLTLFARSPERVRGFLVLAGITQQVPVLPIEGFCEGSYDVVINCVGIGDPGKLREKMSSIFRVTEHFDNLVLDYQGRHPATLYLNLSSGAAYGQDFYEPVREDSRACFDINHLGMGDYYGMAKACSEAKHRALSGRPIVDLRVFGYFSRFIDLETKYLMCEVVTCLKRGEVFVTGSGNIMRDYVHPDDLVALVECCLEHPELNEAFDVYSLKPVAKFEILDSFTTRFGLKVRIEGDVAHVAPTGNKDNYYSVNRRAARIGYQPKYSSIDSLLVETEVLLK
ncbi:hypothetical protein GMLC_37180 [Geomonas limicola]|uniref:NAD-dependent epimerase/dehydratase domain-containing protein n=1 Tax=Geomonas limicola TaxID=2740186 RepID=A0A6V8NGR1_9BACT|nr:NAD(P)-dependent oxidoreductase [Geomonas limicola]GFO70139.1 hypothetical protein GMLC_37180 [Geomonas limicola]